MSGTKKSLGQHWLEDLDILRAIVESANVGEGDYVLEIGPGRGTLTDELLKTGAEITALEFDQDLIPNLQKKYTNCDKVAILSGDIRKFDYSEMPEKYKLVANIPYYLTSNLIRAISETDNPPSSAVLLVQKEVARRLAAEPGDMSILGVTAQFYFECSLGIEVPAKLFIPPPKVDSQVVILRHREKPLFDLDSKEFFKIVKAGFSEKRKTLRNSISGGLGISKDDAVTLLERSGIKPTARAQELSLREWHKIYQAYNG